MAVKYRKLYRHWLRKNLVVIPALFERELAADVTGSTIK